MSGFDGLDATRALLDRFEDEHAEARYVVVFTVSDSGIGMTAETCTRLFQPFSQAPMSNPATQAFFDSLPRPVLLHVGRITPEKSPQDFLKLRLGGKVHSKVVVGGVSGGLTLEEAEYCLSEIRGRFRTAGITLSAYDPAGDPDLDVRDRRRRPPREDRRSGCAPRYD